jgi:hypothetical protein
LEGRGQEINLRYFVLFVIDHLPFWFSPPSLLPLSPGAFDHALHCNTPQHLFLTDSGPRERSPLFLFLWDRLLLWWEGQNAQTLFFFTLTSEQAEQFLT